MKPMQSVGPTANDDQVAEPGSKCLHQAREGSEVLHLRACPE